jgi:hypothetical protein
MRKVYWLLIFLIGFIPSLIAFGLAYQPLGDFLHYVFVQLIGEGSLNLLVGALTGLFLWGSINGLQAGAVLIGIWIIGGVMWLLIKKYAWDKRPSVMKKISLTSNATQSMQTTSSRQTTPAGATVRPTTATSEADLASTPETIIEEQKEE